MTVDTAVLIASNVAVVRFTVVEISVGLGFWVNLTVNFVVDSTVVSGASVKRLTFVVLLVPSTAVIVDVAFLASVVDGTVVAEVALVSFTVVKPSIGFDFSDDFHFPRKKKHPEVAYRSHEFFDPALAPAFPTREDQNRERVSLKEKKTCHGG